MIKIATLTSTLAVALSLTISPAIGQETPQQGYVTQELPQWHHTVVGNTYTKAENGKGVIVAVLDTGVDGTHSEFKNRMVPGYDAVTLKSISDPYINSDGHGHGTHVAGIIAAGNNGVGVTGIAPESKIMPVKVLGYGLGFTHDPVSTGIRWAVDNGAHVINLSLGMESGIKLELDFEVCEAVRYAYENNVTVVVAAGNSGAVGNPQLYPAGCEKSLTVSSLNQELKPSWFSSYDQFVSVSAPGSDIYSTLPYSKSVAYSSIGYGAMSGTSMASPLVAGVAAVLLGADKKITPNAMRTLLENSSLDLLGEGPDAYTGFGIVNVERALNLLKKGALQGTSELNTLSKVTTLPQISNQLGTEGGVRLTILPGWSTAGKAHTIETWDLVTNIRNSYTLKPREIRTVIHDVPDSLVVARVLAETPEGVLEGSWVQIATTSWYKGIAVPDVVYNVEVDLVNTGSKINIELGAQRGPKNLTVFYALKNLKPFKITVKYNNTVFTKTVKNPKKLDSLTFKIKGETINAKAAKIIIEKF